MGSPIVCNDSFDCDGDAATTDPESQVTFPAMAGLEYLIEVGGNDPNAGPGVLSIYCGPPPTAACCAPATGICTDLTESECASAGWDFQGYGTDCPLPPLPADPNPCVSPYCPGSGGCGPYISNVDGSIVNASGCHGYADYTWLKTGMPIGSANPIWVTNGSPDPLDECGIWVDWNQNADFSDPGEEILVGGTPGVGPYDATITPPIGAVLGETRMRIRIVRMDPLDPCGDTALGEVEEYTIVVMPEVP
jgi:hypothetical protein